MDSSPAFAPSHSSARSRSIAFAVSLGSMFGACRVAIAISSLLMVLGDWIASEVVAAVAVGFSPLAAKVGTGRMRQIRPLVRSRSG